MAPGGALPFTGHYLFPATLFTGNDRLLKLKRQSTVRDEDFDFISDLLLTRAGLGLTPERAYLLEGRLTPIARNRDMADVEALLTRARTKPDDALSAEIVEAMMVRETSFFRDRAPFRQFSDIILPDLIKSRAREGRIRIWCAGCSTGQEPYSIAMLINDRAEELTGWSVSVMATDMSGRAIETARKGYYSQFEVQRGLPIELLVKHFSRRRSKWEINDQVAGMVSFHQHNLLDGASQFGEFDIIFCRNVLTYMDDSIKDSIFVSLSETLASDGYLFLGIGETTAGLADRMKRAHGLLGVYSPLPENFRLANTG